MAGMVFLPLPMETVGDWHDQTVSLMPEDLSGRPHRKTTSKRKQGLKRVDPIQYKTKYVRFVGPPSLKFNMAETKTNCYSSHNA